MYRKVPKTVAIDLRFLYFPQRIPPHPRATMPTAIIQCADSGPLESLVYMLNAVGYECFTPSAFILDHLRRIGCDTVFSNQHLVDSMGYDKHFPMPEASISMMDKCDLFVDIKAHRSYHKIVEAWPNLENKVLWYRINGGKPEHIINARGDHGDEVNPPCPVLTPNQWYKEDERAYSCWPPFVRFNEYSKRRWHGGPGSLCLIHGINGWGYNKLVEPMRKLGVRCCGVGAPDGLLEHSQVAKHLSIAKAYVHLKSSDAPGYALYEALASACPVICTRRLIWRCRMQDLLIPDESPTGSSANPTGSSATCLVFDRETHEGLTSLDVAECTEEVARHLDRLKDPTENARIGMAGREQLLKVMWSNSNQADVDSLREFMKRNFK